MTNTLKMKIIVPGKVVDLPDKRTANDELEMTLKTGLGLEDIHTYVELYDDSGNLNEDRILELIGERHGTAAPALRAIPDLSSTGIDGLSKSIVRQLKVRRSEGIPFTVRETYHDHSADEFDDEVPPEGAKKVTQATKKYLSGKNPNNTQLTDGWLTEIPKHLKTLADIENEDDPARTKKRGKIFHEPHHDLSPGVILLDEIFKALVSQVAELIRKINVDLASFDDLREFVDALSGKGVEPNEFTSYILPGGSTTSDPEHHIDPTRVELFMDGDRIYGASVIVAAWTGGTHSNGSTHSS